MSWRRDIALALVAATVVGGCGGGPSSQVSSDVWSRRDDPPAGVARTVPESGRAVRLVCGDGNFYESRSRAIRLDRRPSDDDSDDDGTLPADRPQLGETLQICPPRPDDARRVTLTVRRADGSEISKTLAPYTSDVGYFGSFFLDRSWPLGRAVVTARQGTTVARKTFVIEAPRGRGVRVAQWFGRPSLPNPMPIMVVGQARATVLVDLYASTIGDGTYRYATTLRVATDARGIGEVRVGYDRADNAGYEVRQRDAGASAHISICVACCETDRDETGSQYCAN